MKIRDAALITGISGQDGSYLAELLLRKKYEVIGIIRKNQSMTNKNLALIKKRVKFLEGDLMDDNFIIKTIKRVKPKEVYHLAAQSNVGKSFEDAAKTLHFNIESTYKIIEAIKNFSPKTKFYFAATSEMFGQVKDSPQNEEVVFNPVSPYGISKLAGFYLTKMYRNAYGLFTANGILFNHESPRRGYEFVTRKISLGVAGIKKGTQDKIIVGNLDAARDWGYAEDYVDAMWRILQHSEPDDFVVATGETHTVRDFVENAFKTADISIRWQGSGTEEKGIDITTGKVVVEVSLQLFRPAEIYHLRGDYSKAKQKLNWEPKVKFTELVEKMVKADLS